MNWYDDMAVMSEIGLNWGDMTVLTESGINWS